MSNNLPDLSGKHPPETIEIQKPESSAHLPFLSFMEALSSKNKIKSTICQIETYKNMVVDSNGRICNDLELSM